MKTFQYLVSCHGRNSLKRKLFLSLPLDWKQVSFSDCFFITVSSRACNFAENKPRVGRKRAYTVKILTKLLDTATFFPPSYNLRTHMKFCQQKSSMRHYWYAWSMYGFIIFSSWLANCDFWAVNRTLHPKI